MKEKTRAADKGKANSWERRWASSVQNKRRRSGGGRCYAGEGRSSRERRPFRGLGGDEARGKRSEGRKRRGTKGVEDGKAITKQRGRKRVARETTKQYDNNAEGADSAGPARRQGDVAILGTDHR